MSYAPPRACKPAPAAHSPAHFRRESTPHSVQLPSPVVRRARGRRGPLRKRPCCAGQAPYGTLRRSTTRERWRCIPCRLHRHQLFRRSFRRVTTASSKRAGGGGVQPEAAPPLLAGRCVNQSGSLTRPAEVPCDASAVTSVFSVGGAANGGVTPPRVGLLWACALARRRRRRRRFNLKFFRPRRARQKLPAWSPPRKCALRSWKRSWTI